MKRLKAMIILSFLFKVLNGQVYDKLVGTWIFQYSLQTNGDSCNLPHETDTLTFSTIGTYSWHTNGALIKGEWEIAGNKIKLYNNKAINFEGTVANISYPIESEKDVFIMYEPEGGDISCPIRYYKRKK